MADSNIGSVDESGTLVKKKEIEFDSNTLTSSTLNIEGKLDAYSDTLVEFLGDVFQVDKERAETPARE